jgi:cell division septum initiation protein DivIVA
MNLSIIKRMLNRSNETYVWAQAYAAALQWLAQDADSITRDAAQKAALVAEAALHAYRASSVVQSDRHDLAVARKALYDLVTGLSLEDKARLQAIQRAENQLREWGLLP